MDTKDKARDEVQLIIMRNWIESEIEFFKMLQVLSEGQPKKKKEFAARVSQCRDTILRIDELLATGNLDEN